MLLRLHKLLDFVAYWWHQLTTSRYVLHLERENKRLLAENTALHNTVWGMRGVPGQPIPTRAPAAPADVPMAVRDAQAPVPVAEAEGPKIVRSKRREQRTESVAAFKRQQAAVREHMVDLHNQLNEEIKREREQQQGAGYVVTDAHAAPVQVMEPLEEPAVRAEEA